MRVSCCEITSGVPRAKGLAPTVRRPRCNLRIRLHRQHCCFMGGRDELVWLRQSERLAERLTEVGVNHLLVRLQWADHGFDANLWGPVSQIYLYVLERFLAAVTQ